MASEVRKIDRPLVVLAATVAAGALMLAVTLRIEPAAQAMGAGGLTVLWVFLCGGLLFAIYAPAAARWSRSVPPHDCIILGVFGVTFAGWGLLAAMCMGGFFGIAHAAVCTAALGALVRDWRVVIAPIPALAPAWAVTFRLSEGSGALTMSQTMWMLTPVLVWNLEMAVVLAVWSAWRHHNPLPERRRDRGSADACPACGYDLMGLREPVCPECGASVHLPQAAAPGDAEPR